MACASTHCEPAEYAVDGFVLGGPAVSSNPIGAAERNHCDEQRGHGLMEASHDVEQQNLRRRPFDHDTLTAGAAFAADQAMQSGQMQADQAQTRPEQAALKDAGKLSADGPAPTTILLTRLATFDGRVKDAKTFVNKADAALGKAKTDDSVFMKAEADLKAPDVASTGTAAATTPTQKPVPNATGSSSEAASGEKQAAPAQSANMTTPKKWLPVDAEMSVDENYTASAKKAAAVADANKSLAKGDKQGAMEKLKLADVNVAYVMAVVPLNQTLSDVHQAATLVNDGKYYEASQMLRQVQDSTRYDMLDVSGAPMKADSQGAGKTDQAPATH